MLAPVVVTSPLLAMLTELLAPSLSARNADLRGFDVARIVHRDRAVIAIGPDVDAGDWIDIAAIGDTDRTVCPICLRPDAEGGWAFRLDIAAVLDGDGTAARRK